MVQPPETEKRAACPRQIHPVFHVLHGQKHRQRSTARARLLERQRCNAADFHVPHRMDSRRALSRHQRRRSQAFPRSHGRWKFRDRIRRGLLRQELGNGTLYQYRKTRPRPLESSSGKRPLETPPLRSTRPQRDTDRRRSANWSPALQRWKTSKPPRTEPARSMSNFPLFTPMPKVSHVRSISTRSASALPTN